MIDPNGQDLVLVTYKDGRRRKVDPVSAQALVDRGDATTEHDDTPESATDPETEPAAPEAVEELPTPDPEPGPSIVIDGYSAPG